MFSVLFAAMLAAQCGPQGCGPIGGPPMMTPFFPPQPAFIQPPQSAVVAPTNSGLTPQQVDAAKGDFDLNPTFHYGPGTVLVRDQFGNLVPSHLPTHVSYPGEAMQPYVHGKQYPPRKSASKPAVKDDRPKGQGCPNPNCKCLPPCSCFECKCDDRPAGDGVDFRTSGVNREKVEEAKQRCVNSINGRPVSQQTAYNAAAGVGGGTIPDDGKKARLTFISSDPAKREEFLKSVANDPSFNGVRDNIICAAYDPKDPMVPKEFGFEEGVLLTNADGSKPESSKQWAAGPWSEAVRKRDPNFDPLKVPDPTKTPTPGPGPSMGWQLALSKWVSENPVIAFVAGFALLTFFRQQPAPQPVKA